jgi:hypothetical protein
MFNQALGNENKGLSTALPNDMAQNKWALLAFPYCFTGAFKLDQDSAPRCLHGLGTPTAQP